MEFSRVATYVILSQVIKQSHIILNFLAMEGKITNNHLDCIWQSAQLKHCSKQVHDLLPPLIKNLEAGPVLHLYDLVQKLPVKEHTEQTIYLSQVLQKFIWTSGGTFSHLLQEVNTAERRMEGPGRRKKKMKKSSGGSSEDDEDDDVSDDVLTELADIDDNDDIEEYSEVDDEDEDEDDDDDLATSDESDTELRRPERDCKEEKVKQERVGGVKKLKISPTNRKLKDSGVKRVREKAEPEEESKKAKVEVEEVEGGKLSLPAPVPCIATGKTNLWGSGARWSRDSGQGAVMTELANLVGAAGGHNPPPPHGDMFPAGLRGFRPGLERGYRGEMFDPAVDVSDDGSAMDRDAVSPASSHASNKSDKNLADFADEESTDEEMVRQAQAEQLGSMLHQHQQLASMAQLYQSRLAAPRLTRRQRVEGAKLMAHYRMDKVAEHGNTLLWDLIQDGAIELLAEGLPMEAEKALTNLLCYNMDRFIRIKFIEGCLSNLQQNKSVVVSLRLLPKLFQSFQNFPGSDTHEMILYTEKTHDMTKLFFENLQRYTAERKQGLKENSFYSHTAQVQARLQFLAMIFSNQLSPECFRLHQSQVSILWECLANDPVSSDDLFHWLLVQAHSKDQHALGIDSVRFIHREKLPGLRPETMTGTGLNLLSQLTSLVRMSEGNPDSWCNMSQVWRIALQANNTDVSMKAIHILNTAYLGRGEEFLTTCMEHLTEAQGCLDKEESEDNLVRIQRALLLLKSHLETFRKKYAFHFRRLAIEGNPVSSHAELVEVRHSSLIRINVQPGGAISEKITFDMHSSDLVADLRAEISVWWENKLALQGGGQELGGPSMLGSLLGNPIIGPAGPAHLRLISQGQEITQDLDERSLAELGFKDLQTVFASLGTGPSRSSFSKLFSFKN